MKREIDRLRDMLTEAGIPFENRIEYWPVDCAPPMTCPADVFKRNQLTFGGTNRGIWRFSAIYQFGSNGRRYGLLETWGFLGWDKDKKPQVMTAEQAFEIIKRDYEKRR